MIETRSLVLAILVSAFASIGVSQDPGADRRLPDGFIDGAVDSKGNTFVLRRYSGLSRTNPDGKTQALDIASGLRATFAGSGIQALALSDAEGPAVLWSGSKEGTVQSVVTFVDSGRNVQLARPVSMAPGLSIAPNQDIYVLGFPLPPAPQQLVHRYSKDGEYLGSFDPYGSGDSGAPAVRSKFGRARILATPDGIFVLCPLFDTKVVQCIDGTAERTIDFGTASPEGWPRRPVTMYSKDGRACVQVFVSGPIDVARQEFYLYEKGDFRLAATMQSVFGQVIGQKPNGQFVTRDMTGAGDRDRIGTGLP
jgi:hypothetical protein